ncbi:prephenate dehydrogenase/arogenate dehydrogenase family protein [Pelagicoccus sp. SDUM812003]|uniref:prephenate dehydrogenase n=1 Tax=Pelagicoccus sp. SDUM812003 TaxID=3041267 RepID=UPI00280F21F8|nr:prephenate dehydrogenase/arogenate dehydrogenase family protein [Pelagicoccus sp. SDUM812003]MDQ8203693.1 prephenate dehydrogenase/arogenate dehydrogenase family protein [Pelagicoccus sp. SDUM812003]
MFDTLTIIAPGLLGASLAMAAHQKKLARKIAIYARRQEAVDALNEQPWCDFASTDLTAACQDSDMIVLCAPVERIITLAEQIAPGLSRNPIVTDVGSVKADIVQRCETALAGKARFVGSHPMAGSEKTGMENACSDLFEQRVCFVTPSHATDPQALQTTVAFWKAVGSTVLEETPDNHDRIVAQVSHLPHLLASALASFLQSSQPRAGDLCGNGLRDTTRIASGHPELWGQIVSQNRKEILRAIADFQSHLSAVSDAIASENDAQVLDMLSRGKQFRDSL